MKTKTCSACRKDKPVDQFSKNKSKKDGLQGRCKPCMSDYIRDHYEQSPRQYLTRTKKHKAKVQEYIREFLRTHPCTKCGEEDPVVLDFDHIRGSKFFNIGDAAQRGIGIPKLKAEIDKCQVLCANCHRRKTHAERLASKIYVAGRVLVPEQGS